MTPPSRVAFSEHALEQLANRGLSAEQVADAVLNSHDRRRRNPHSADWVVRARGIVAAYNWPDGEDQTTAYIVSAWPE
jgi:hypothetical protein